MIKAIADRIKECENIALMAHINEDGDALGSVFALCRVLENMGKKAVCFLDDEPERRLAFLDGKYEIYKGEEIPCFDLCFALDCADKSRLGDLRVKIFENAKSTICIDHHITNKGYADINIIKPEATSTGEVLFEVLAECEISLDSYSAMCLYTAIASDSGCFKYSSTSPKTMRIAADLLEFDFDHAEVLRLLFDTEEIENIKLKGFVMNNIESFFDGKIQLVITDEKILEKFSVSEKDATDLVNIPRMVAGCEIAAELKKRKGKIRLSLRSHRVDISDVAKEFGGGGHKFAAGADIDAKTMDEAKKMVIDALIKKLSLEK